MEYRVFPSGKYHVPISLDQKVAYIHQKIISDHNDRKLIIMIKIIYADYTFYNF